MNIVQCVTTMVLAMSLSARAVSQISDSQLALGRRAIERRTGCYLVDYSFVETDALKPGYVRDNRVYDVNRDKSIKEWIYADEISPTRIRLQHILFGVDLSGKLMENSILKHTGEDWEYDAPFLYDYAGELTWNVKTLKETPRLWTRRVTNLDDGLRYQCAASWKTDTAYPDWSCTNLAPIPGRETRDMKRKDYTLLDRTSRLIVYDKNWLEREANTKIVDENGTRALLVREVGKTWYVRLPDSECSAARDFVKPRIAFWKVVRETWAEILNGNGAFIEKPAMKDQSTRYERMSGLEETYLNLDLSNAASVRKAHDEILAVIKAFREQR